LCHPYPTRQSFVFGEELEDRAIRPVDVCRVSRERDPAEGALAFTEQRAHVLLDESRDLERALDAGLLGVRTDVVPVLEADRALLPEG
jgi:hypothetical protein